MSDWKLRLYHQMPPFMRNWVASLRGYQLRSWRYGPETEQLVEEALERDRWSTEQWKTYQENRLQYVLHRAATQVPYYRQQWSERRRKGDQSSWEYLENWPVLRKESIRKYGQAMIVDSLNPNKLLSDTTGGTTGTPLRIWLSKQVQRQLYALFEARVRAWNGVSRKEHWGTMGGQLIIPVSVKQAPYWVYNWALNQVYLSTNHISTATSPEYIDVLRRFRATHLIAYTSSITYLASQASKAALEPLADLRVVITNAEGLYPWQRTIIREALGCDVRETYGMVELTACASERNGELLIWPEVGLIEVFADSSDVLIADGESGRFICTGLLNMDMPLIRYEVGDRGSVVWSSEISEYNHPRIQRLDGRNIDMLMTKDGKQVWYFNPVFTGLPVTEVQLVQHSLEQVEVIYVPEDEFNHVTKEIIGERIRQRLGDVGVVFTSVDYVPREKNGKFRPVVCRLSTEDRSAAGER